MDLPFEYWKNSQFRDRSVFQLRVKCIEKLGKKCVRCGFKDPRALQIDHVKGNGAQERRELKKQEFYEKVLTDTKGEYQLLCANCNLIKRIENHEDRGKNKRPKPIIEERKVTINGKANLCVTTV